MEAIRLLGPAALSLITVLMIDSRTRRRGLQPPGFRVPEIATASEWKLPLLRRGLALTTLGLVLWFGVFGPLGSLGLDREIDLTQVTVPQLFLLHAIFALALGFWYWLGFAGAAARPTAAAARWPAQFGLLSPMIGREIAIGLLAGVAAWLAVLGLLLAVGVLIWWLGGEDLLPPQPPQLIPWIAALPIWLRLALSLSAGVVEEVFFRGFLQPRVGVWLSTVLFVLAHASYEQLLMLVGITVLSVIYGALVRWRQTIWPAIAAHTLFDSLQLLVVIPTALELLPQEQEGLLVPVAVITEIVGGAGQ